MEKRIFTGPNIIFILLSLIAIFSGDSVFLFLLTFYALIVIFIYILSSVDIDIKKLFDNFQMIFWFTIFAFIILGSSIFIVLGPIIFTIALFMFFKK